MESRCATMRVVRTCVAANLIKIVGNRGIHITVRLAAYRIVVPAAH